MTQKNRRKHPRVRASGIAAHVRGPAGRHPCVVENISSGGLFVRTDRLIDVGLQLEIDLVRPGWKRPLSFFARVTSRIDPLAGRYARRTPGMGLQFYGKMDEETRARLQALLRELGAPEPEPELPSPEDLAGVDLPVELDEELLLEPDLPLWKQVQQLTPEPAADEEVPLLEEVNGAVVPFDTAPVAVAVEAAPRADPPRRAQAEAPDAGRLMLQIRGLLYELSEAQQKLSQREAELTELRAELDAARAALGRVVKKS